MLLLLSCFQVVYAQKARITLNLNQVTVKKALVAIEKKCDYTFLYNDADIDVNRKVSVNAKNEELSSVLHKILPNATWTVNNKRIIITPANKGANSQAAGTNANAGGKTVRGRVTGTNGEPLVGVSVIVMGKNTGVITDVDGNYTIAADNGEQIQFSYVGYTPRRAKVSDKATLDVTLKEDPKALDEVVVVGYGTQKKINLTGAVATVSGKSLENRPVTKIAEALQGTVANLNISSSNGGAPGSTQHVDVRGYSGLGTTSTPLVVVDGVQGASLDYINPDDVESISVLKDAASAAIYGSSAPFGVIIITTKQGKNDAKARVTYSNNFGFAKPINLPKMANSLDFANIYNEAADNAGIARPFTEENIQRIKDYQAGVMTDETIAAPGKDEWYTWTGNGNNDWFDIFFKDVSFRQQHNLGVSGGTSKTNYYVGLGYNQVGGLYEFGDDSYKRYSVRANLSTKVNDWMSFSVRTNFTRATSDTPNTYSSKTGGNYMHQLSRKWPTAPMYNPNGEYSYPSDIRLMTEGGRSKGETDKAILTGEVVITPLKGWNITANYTFDGNYYTGSDHVKTLYVTMPSGGKILYSGTTPNSFSRTSRKVQRHVINAYTTYETQIGKHSIKAMAGFMQELYDYLQQYAGNSNLYSDDLPALSLTYGKSPSISDNAYQLATRAAFGRINYSFADKYLLEFNGRYDGTSKFLKNKRFKFYPGVSAGWIVSKENFWESMQDVVNHLKIRGSYAVLGDQSAVGYYPFYPSMSTTAPTSTNWIFAGGREAYVVNPGLVNSDLTWITTATLDFGVDFAFLSNRLDLSFDWYKRMGKNYVGPANKLPAILGTTLPNTNDSEIETTGWELSIGWKDRFNLAGNPFDYSVNFVLSDYMGKVTKYENPTGLITTWYEGRKMGEIWGYETYGLFQSEDEIASAPSQSKISSKWYPGDVRYVDQNGDNAIDWGKNTLDDHGDKKIIGNSTPRFQFGLNLKAEYKGWDFGIFFQGVMKRDAWISSNIFWGITGGQWQSCVFPEHLNRWTPETPDGYFPRYYLNGNGSKNMQTQTGYLQNAAYMRVKNVQLGYSLPKSLISKINFERVKFFVSVDNLATISSMPAAIDPEFSASDGKVYPLQRTWSMGVNLAF
ncbi:MAG: TonB-dependent receptor [Muribaculaceae bacterium]